MVTKYKQVTLNLHDFQSIKAEDLGSAVYFVDTLSSIASNSIYDEIFEVKDEIKNGQIDSKKLAEFKDRLYENIKKLACCVEARKSNCQENAEDVVADYLENFPKNGTKEFNQLSTKLLKDGGSDLLKTSVLLYQGLIEPSQIISSINEAVNFNKDLAKRDIPRSHAIIESISSPTEVKELKINYNSINQDNELIESKKRLEEISDKIRSKVSSELDLEELKKEKEKLTKDYSKLEEEKKFNLLEKALKENGFNNQDIEYLIANLNQKAIEAVAMDLSYVFHDKTGFPEFGAPAQYKSIKIVKSKSGIESIECKSFIQRNDFDEQRGELINTEVAEVNLKIEFNENKSQSKDTKLSYLPGKFSPKSVQVEFKLLDDRCEGLELPKCLEERVDKKSEIVVDKPVRDKESKIEIDKFTIKKIFEFVKKIINLVSEVIINIKSAPNKESKKVIDKSFVDKLVELEKLLSEIIKNIRNNPEKTVVSESRTPEIVNEDKRPGPEQQVQGIDVSKDGVSKGQNVSPSATPKDQRQNKDSGRSQ